MARSRRASSVATGIAVDAVARSNSTAGLPPSSVSNRPNLVKKSSRLAIFLKHLKSPSNSDGEDNDDGEHSDSDLDFGCTGLKAFDELDELLHEDDDGELHISLDDFAHPLQDHPLESLPTRSASITDSLTSSISSITLDSATSISEHTLSTPSSYSQPNSTRSSISHPVHLNLSSTTSSSVSPTKKTTFFIHGSCTPSPRISIGTSTAIQPAFIVKEELEESELGESEEEGILRRQQEEQAAIEALEAYFAYRKASDSLSSVSISSSDGKRNSLIRSSTSSSNDSSKDEVKNKLIIKDTRSSSDSGVPLPEETDITTLKAIPHSSPYFEKYANEPLYTLTSAREDQSAQSTSRSAMRSRRSEASLRTAAVASSASAGANGIVRQKRRPSLANGLMPIQVRPRGYTYSASPCSWTSSHTHSSIPSPSIPSTSSLNRDQILQVSTLPHSPASNNSPSPSIYAVSIPSSPSTPSQQSHSQASTLNTQIVSYTRGTPASPSFLNFGDSPLSPQFKNGSMKKGASMREYEVIPSPPRSSSLQYALSNGGMQEAQSQALGTAVTRKMAKEEERKEEQATSPTLPTSITLATPTSPSFITAYQERLEGYRFPDHSISRGRSKSTSSAIRTPSSQEEREMEEEQDRVTTTAPPRIYNPLGQATASRRGSLVSGCLPISQNRNRAGSLAATMTPTNAARDGTVALGRNAVYDYI